MTDENLELQKYKVEKQVELANRKLDEGGSLMVGGLNLTQVTLLADKFSRAGPLVPKEFQGEPEKCFVAIYKGASLGLDAFTSLQRIAVVNGRATIWGDTAMALVRQSGLLEDFEETVETADGKLIAKCMVKRVGDKRSHVSEFSQEDAVKANLWGKAGTWQTHPKRMLKYKARAFALRDIFSDVIDGLHLKEEMEGEGQVDVTPKQAPVVKNNLELKQIVSELQGVNKED